MRTASFSSSVFPLLANLRRFLLVALLALGLAACGQQKPTFQNIDVTGGSEFGKDFKLTDHTGKQRTLADFKGKAVVMFFGYTHCPDVCPTTMVEWKTVMEQLGPDADRVQVLFITVDPERDTQALLAQYVPAFDPRFLGMRPADEAIAAPADQGLQGVLRQGARQRAGQLYGRPFGRQLCVRSGRAAAAVHPPWPGDRADRQGHEAAAVLSASIDPRAQVLNPHLRSPQDPSPQVSHACVPSPRYGELSPC
ncbi:hypothetical protein OJJOAM_001408 [Cupriavidus sp. H18C1]